MRISNVLGVDMNISNARPDKNTTIISAKVIDKSVKTKPTDTPDGKTAVDLFSEAVSDAGISISDGSFNNSLLKLGASDAGINSAEFLMDMITYNRQSIINCYHGSWIFRRIIDKVSQDMWSSGITINGDTNPDSLQLIYKRLSKLRSQLIWATQQCRLFGGAASLMMVNDGSTTPEDLMKPLNIRNIKKGSSVQLFTADRWYGLEPSMEKVTNINSIDYGKPKYYTFYLDNGIGDSGSYSVTVHHSRVLRFENRRSCKLINQRLNGWGLSELEHIYQDLMTHENAKGSTASLIQKALLEIIKVGGMRGMMQGMMLGSSAQQAQLTAQLAGLNNFRTNNLVFMDKEDDYSQIPYQFSGLDRILEVQKDLMAGAAEMPKVLLYGETKGGMTSDSPAEMEFYAGTILGKQDDMIRPVLDKLLPVLFMSAGVPIPADLDYDFESIAGVTAEKKLNLVNSTIQAVSTCVNDGLMTRKTALKELQQIQKMTGFGTNINEEDFKLAEETDLQSQENPEGSETVPGGDDMDLDMPTPQNTEATDNDYEKEKSSIIDRILGKKRVKG